MLKCYGCYLSLIAIEIILSTEHLDRYEFKENRCLYKSTEIVYRVFIQLDYDLRQTANYDGCYEDLMEIRHHCLTHLQSLKEIHAIELPDESDEFEAEKIAVPEKVAARTAQ